MLVPQSILTASLERVCCYDPHVLKEKTETSLELLPEETAQPLMAEHSKHSCQPGLLTLRDPPRRVICSRGAGGKGRDHGASGVCNLWHRKQLSHLSFRIG